MRHFQQMESVQILQRETAAAAYHCSVTREDNPSVQARKLMPNYSRAPKPRVPRPTHPLTRASRPGFVPDPAAAAG